MKKLLTLALALVALTAFTGLSAAQERKAPAKPTAIPPANKVTLSKTKNVASLKGCPVTAWVGHVWASGSPSPKPTANYPVTFVKDGGAGFVNPQGGTSDTKGEVPATVGWNTKIHAEVKDHQGQTLLTSNPFTCPAEHRAE